MNQNQALATCVIVVATILGMLTASGSEPAEYLTMPAYVMGLGIALAMAIEANGNVRNIVRADWIAIFALYGLTMAEFLTDQPDFNVRSSIPEAEQALWLLTLGFGGLVVGRHWYGGKTSNGFQISMLPPHLVLGMFLSLIHI